MNFSAILDISSFFIGMIINLLLIALICYYFKRKYENLEIAQNEQAKVLYQLLQQNTPQPKVKTLNEMFNTSKDLADENDSESETDCDSDSDSDSESEKNVKTKIINLDINSEKIELNENDLNEINGLNEIEEINVDTPTNLDTNIDKKTIPESDYSKMSIKQLKEILSVKGINPTKLKKNEMIELIEKSQCETKQQLREREQHHIEILKPELNMFRAIENPNYVRKNIEERNKKSNEYYHANKSTVLKLQKEYNEKNKEAISIRRKKYREENKEKIKLQKSKTRDEYNKRRREKRAQQKKD